MLQPGLCWAQQGSALAVAPAAEMDMLGCYCQGKNGNRTEGSTAAPSDSHDPECVQGDKSHCWGHERGGLCSHKCGPAAGAAVSAGAHPGHRSQLGPRDKCQARLERIFLTNTGRKTVHKNTAKASRAVLTQEQPGGAHPGLGEHRAAAPGLWCDTGDTWGPQEDNTEHRPSTHPVPAGFRAALAQETSPGKPGTCLQIVPLFFQGVP